MPTSGLISLGIVARGRRKSVLFRTDFPGKLGCVEQRPERSPEYGHIDCEEENEDRDCNPPDAAEKLPDDVVDEDVAMFHILRYLNPYIPAANLEGNAGSA